ncbi:lytic polysaccharide monooxygenase [Xylariaceae sp. FL0016]|nr:lytic polysaccharide monooxygenase [Xylariaceae sp. FL0016]
MFFTKATVSAAIIAAANAHVVMTDPVPYNPDKLLNAPLEADGSNFPCKFDDSYTSKVTQTNSFALGSSQDLALMGSAVHGGGSCQISITYDQPPTKDSVFKVIHSIEGGCPAKNMDGNYEPESATFVDPNTYNYTIPSDIPAGKGTIVWTWFNRIGNREMYMNCGPLELTGTGGDQSNFDSLPDMVVANIGSYAKTTENDDYVFADPGDSVAVFTGANQIQTIGSAGSGSGSGATSTAAPAASTTAAGGVFMTTGAASATSVAETTAAASATSVAEAPTAATSSTAGEPTSGSGSSSGSTGAMSGACTTEGEFYCSGTAFQQCASGQWSAEIEMAAGTSCTPGQSSNMQISAVRGKKRAIRSFRA